MPYVFTLYSNDTNKSQAVSSGVMLYLSKMFYSQCGVLTYIHIKSYIFIKIEYLILTVTVQLLTMLYKL